MWMDREKILDKVDGIIAYVKSQNCFHDYKLGNIEIRDNQIKLMIEEDMKNECNEGAHIWNFSFTDIEALSFELDCIIPAYIDEVDIKGYSVRIDFNNGYISFTAMEMVLGILKSCM